MTLWRRAFLGGKVAKRRVTKKDTRSEQISLMVMSGILRVHEVLIQSELTLGRTRKFIPPPWYKVGGGGGGRGWNPSGRFLMCYSISILPSWILTRIRNQVKIRKKW